MRNWNLFNDEWTPFRDFDRLHRNMNQLMSDFGRTTSVAEGTSAHAFPSFSPACDVQETSGHYVLNFDLPGLKKDNIEIKIEDQTLIVSGERKEEQIHKDAVGQRTERVFGRFQRSFSLPTTVDADKVEAHYEDGVLSLVIPKKEAAKARSIKVHEGKGNILDRVFGRKPELKSASEKSN